MDSPLVSIIIPCYNQGKYLKEAVDSVLASTYKNFEIIVINDGSYLDIDFLQTFSAPKTKIIHQENQGVIKSRNKGISQSSGKYILPLDADDKIHPEYIEKAVNIMENNNKTGIVYCEAEFFGNKNCKWKLTDYDYPNILYKNIIFPSAMFKKSDWEQVKGYKEEMNLGCEDWEFWLSLIESGVEVYRIPQTLFYYRKQENLRTKNAIKLLTYIRIRCNIIKFHKNLYKKDFIKIFIPLLLDVIKNSLSSLLKNRGKVWQKFFGKITKRNLNTNKKKNINNKINKFNKYCLTTTKRAPKIIVSLTSFPERIYDIHFSIYSLLNQTLKPDEIILWLAEEEFPEKENNLSAEILKLKENGLTIKWHKKNLKVYLKYIPAMLEYPNDIIITADDDIYYSRNFVEKLYNSYLDNPTVLHCNKAYKISLSQNRQILPYEDWDKNVKTSTPSFLNFNLGVGGVLYPPKSLYKDFDNEDIFRELSPSDDDVWAWAMSVLNGTKINVVKNTNFFSVNPQRENGELNEKTLYSINKNGNSFKQMSNILIKYPKIFNILMNELGVENE